MSPDRGLCARIARRIVLRAQEFECDALVVSAAGCAANARSLVDLLMLGVAPGEQVTVRCRGPQARLALDALVALLTTGLMGMQ